MYNKYLAELSKEQLLELLSSMRKTGWRMTASGFSRLKANSVWRRPCTMMRRRGSALL